MTESPHHLRRFFFFFFNFFFRYDLPIETWRKRRWAKLTARRFDKKNHTNEAADHRKNQEATKNSPTHTYGDFFFFQFFFSVRLTDANKKKTKVRPSWQHEDLIKNHRKEAADHRKNQEATKNSPTHTYGDFLFFTFFHLKNFFVVFLVFVCESWDVSPPTAETGSPDHLQRFFFFFFFLVVFLVRHTNTKGKKTKEKLQKIFKNNQH